MKNKKIKNRKYKKQILFALCSMLFVLCFFGPSFAFESNREVRIALFPFENLSDDKNALFIVMPVLRKLLEAKGVEVLDEDSLDKFLLKERIRCTGYITKDIARKLGEELNVKAVLVGSINSFFSGENPKAGFSARLIRSSNGDILWANHAAATGDDFTKILGLGRITTVDVLASRVMDKLLQSFTVSPANKEIEATYRIAVMPFQNKSKSKDAGLVATYMFIGELFRNKKFVPIEYGEVRRLIVDLRMRDKGEVDFKRAGAISESAGVDGIVVGTVEIYNEGEGSAPPEASISARLMDARKDKLLWANSYSSRGDDDILIFDWKKLNSAESVAYKIVSRQVKEMSKAKWE